MGGGREADGMTGVKVGDGTRQRETTTTGVSTVQSRKTPGRPHTPLMRSPRGGRTSPGTRLHRRRSRLTLAPVSVCHTLWRAAPGAKPAQRVIPPRRPRGRRAMPIDRFSVWNRLFDLDGLQNRTEVQGQYAKAIVAASRAPRLRCGIFNWKHTRRIRLNQGHEFFRRRTLTARQLLPRWCQVL